MNTPIYEQTFIDTNQPVHPWTWPVLAQDFPECSCDADVHPQVDCTIHGTWLARYGARWLR